MNFWHFLSGHRTTSVDDPPSDEQLGISTPKDEEERRQALEETQRRREYHARRLRALEYEQSLPRRRRPRFPDDAPRESH